MRTKLLTLLFFILFGNLTVQGQTVVPFNEMIEQAKGDVYTLRFEDVTFVNKTEPKGYIDIGNTSIYFTNCTFQGLTEFNGIRSNSSLMFDNCTFEGYPNIFGPSLSLSIYQSQFQYIELRNSNSEHSLSITNSALEPLNGASFKIENSKFSQLLIDSVQFYGLDLFENEINEYLIKNSDFNPIGRPNLVGGDPDYVAVLDIQQDYIESINIENNKYFAPVYPEGEESNIPTIFKIEFAANNMTIDNNKFEVDMDLSNVQVSNQFIFENNDIKGNIALDKTSFSEVFNIIPFEQFLTNKIALLKVIPPNRPYGGGRNDIELHTQDSIDIANSSDFLRMIRVYQNLLDIYKQSGDLGSWNLAYKEKKRLDTKRLRYDYGRQPSFQSFFSWRLNQFILFFSDYGTNPAKAVKISIYIILLFSLFYFFFPSEWDKEAKVETMKKLKSLFSDKGGGSTVPALFRDLFLSMFNALTLSINSFTTLGFGNIPTTGIARYMAIIEGFIGWFLLSMFTVALINQVLF